LFLQTIFGTQHYSNWSKAQIDLGQASAPSGDPNLSGQWKTEIRWRLHPCITGVL